MGIIKPKTKKLIISSYMLKSAISQDCVVWELVGGDQILIVMECLNLG